MMVTDSLWVNASHSEITFCLRTLETNLMIELFQE
jgi:hypothetical protein